MKRLVTFALILSILLSIASCGANDEKNNTDTSRETVLTVESVNVKYPSELKESLIPELVASIEAILYKAEGVKLTDKEKAELVSLTDEKLFSSLERVPVYADELTQISSSLAHLASAEGDMPTLLYVYERLSSYLGNERSGTLCYEMLCLYFEQLHADYTEKYTQTSYPWHLAEAEKCQSMLDGLTSVLGKEKLTSAVNVFAFCSALYRGMLTSESSDNSLYGIGSAELGMLIRRHAAELYETSLTQNEWRIAARIAEYVANRHLKLSDPIENAVISELIDNSFLERVSENLPDLISFYKTYADVLRDDVCDAFISGDSEARLISLCLSLSECRDELVLFLNALKASALPDADIGRSSLIAAGYGEAYQKFTDGAKAKSADELASAVTSYGDAPTHENYELLESTLISYIYGISPCLAFAVSQRMADTEQSKGELT